MIWIYRGRRPAALVPILLTQLLLVLLLRHQFAFLGLVESSSALLMVFGEFALFTVGPTVALTDEATPMCANRPGPSPDAHQARVR